MAGGDDDNGLTELRKAGRELRDAITHVRDFRGTWRAPEQLPAEANGWNFTTFEKYISQRFADLSLQLRERYEAQQTGVTAALAAAEKAVNAALIAAEKAVDKAEGAQQLRNEAQNEFRASLSDLSKLMWTREEGSAAVGSVNRELSLTIGSVETRVAGLEKNYSNLQGRMWAVSALWGIFVIAVTIAVTYIAR